MDEKLINQLGSDRINSRQIDELIGIARGVAADGRINQEEIEFLQKWLAANIEISGQPVIRTLYRRVNEMLSDGIADDVERIELLDTLNQFSNRDFELGEVLKSSSLPLSKPAPNLSFAGRVYCFTGTFTFGQRKHCEHAVVQRGGIVSGLTQKVEYLVVGAYATESWKHSTFGSKIIQACEWRDQGMPIAIVSEEHWLKHL
jgi:NAD-dependent DNA ligase